MSYTHIETIELGSSQSSITFSSIPQDFDDLVLKLSLRGDRSAAATSGFVKINTLTTGFTIVRLYGSGSGATSDSQSSGAFGFIPTATSTSNTFGNVSFYFSNYTASANKSFSVDAVSENNATQAFQVIGAGLWSNTAAITELSFNADVGNLVSGSIISLFGVTAGGDGTVTTS